MQKGYSKPTKWPKTTTLLHHMTITKNKTWCWLDRKQKLQHKRNLVGNLKLILLSWPTLMKNKWDKNKRGVMHGCAEKHPIVFFN